MKFARIVDCAVLASGAFGRSTEQSSCDTIKHGYDCGGSSRHWGQYSPYFSVPSKISTEVPDKCEITFAQILSRHGARFPTSSAGAKYNATISKIKANATQYEGQFSFLKNYVYDLGSDNLTVFGQDQLYNSGAKFYNRYKKLASKDDIFIRSSGEARVVQSALNFTIGYNTLKKADKGASSKLSSINLIISEDPGFNNSLDPSTCNEFEDGFASEVGSAAQGTWANIFVPAIQKRVNKNLPGANLTISDTINIMELCPFNTVNNANGSMSAFCHLFTHDEWLQYNYYKTLGEYYGNGNGNPLGPSQGVGWGNELIARLTGKPVHDDTTTNQTLDSSSSTFPLNKNLYADFGHDSPMVSMFSALGFYNDTMPLPNNTIVEAKNAGGFSAAWVVPFAARAYFEKLSCAGHSEEMVRVIINDRVLPLTQCGGNELGLCTLKKFIGSLSFVKDGGHWAACFP